MPEAFVIPQWISEIRTLGWDLDGTLYPPNRELTGLIEKRQYEAVAATMGWDTVRARQTFRKRYSALGSNTKTLVSFGIDGQAFFTSVWDEIPLEQFLHRDQRLVLIFRGLKNKRHFLISNSNRVDQIRKKLRLLGLSSSIFECIVSTVDLGAVKPDERPFLFASERLSVPVKQVLYVGDRVETDIRGAGAVGMRTCLVWGKSSEADISLPTVYDVGDLWGKVKSQKLKVKSTTQNAKLPIAEQARYGASKTTT